MLVTVNASLKFTYINVGAPGRCNDSSVYSRSKLSEVINDPIYDNHYILVDNVKIKAHLIADSAFSSSSSLMKPYPDRPGMLRSHGLFNYRLSRCRSTVERYFGLLKNCFRCLHKKMEYKLHNIINIIKAATILHNLCIISGDNLEVDWDTPQVIYKKHACNGQTAAGNNIREALTVYFLRNP